MAHRGRDLTLLEEFAHDLRVEGVAREVEHGAVAADVEDRVILVDIDLRQCLRRREFLLHRLVVEEADGLVVFEVLARGAM